MAELEEAAEAVARRLVKRRETIAVAESSTGGLISAALLGVPGASAYFAGGAVVYNAEGIQRLTGLTSEDLAKARSSTAPRAALLAEAIRRKLGATWGIAETGAAGPTGNRYGDAAGHTALAVAGPAAVTQVVETGDSDRRRNMDRFAVAALRLLESAIESSAKS